MGLHQEHEVPPECSCSTASRMWIERCGENDQTNNP